MAWNISAGAIRNPIPPILLILALVFAGWTAYGRLPVNQLPNVNFGGFTVGVGQAGAAPEEMETQITQRIEGPVLAVHQSDAVLDAMDAWNKGTHGKSGLIDRVKASTLDEAAAQAQVIAFLKQYVPAGKSPMCGNSICQDRRFLAKDMPALEAFFHYRNLDVSTLKELARRWKPGVLDGFKKAQAHTALADIHESIDELLHYRQYFLQL